MNAPFKKNPFALLKSSDRASESHSPRPQRASNEPREPLPAPGSWRCAMSDEMVLHYTKLALADGSDEGRAAWWPYIEDAITATENKFPGVLARVKSACMEADAKEGHDRPWPYWTSRPRMSP